LLAAGDEAEAEAEAHAVAVEAANGDVAASANPNTAADVAAPIRRIR